MAGLLRVHQLRARSLFRGSRRDTGSRGRLGSRGSFDGSDHVARALEFGEAGSAGERCSAATLAAVRVVHDGFTPPFKVVVFQNGSPKLPGPTRG